MAENNRRKLNRRKPDNNIKKNPNIPGNVKRTVDGIKKLKAESKKVDNKLGNANRKLYRLKTLSGGANEFPGSKLKIGGKVEKTDEVSNYYKKRNASDKKNAKRLLKVGSILKNGVSATTAIQIGSEIGQWMKKNLPKSKHTSGRGSGRAAFKKK